MIYKRCQISFLLFEWGNSMKPKNIAIVGATGLVGTTFLKVIEEYRIPYNRLRLFASEKSVGKKVDYQGKIYEIETLQPGCFKGVDFALFSAVATISKLYAPQAVLEGAIVIDNSSAWRMDNNVPLVVPEVNMEDIDTSMLIANPNCSTIQSVLPLYALDKTYGIEQVEYNTYQAVSGSGYKGVHDLERTKNNETHQFYPYNISETCIPQIDVFLEDGYTKEEHKMIDETRKILHKPDLKISATCVRVPVAHSHAVSIRVKLHEQVTVQDIKETLRKQEGIIVVDDPSNNMYPVSTMSNGTDNVYVGRIRKDLFDDYTVLLYCVADNIRKGAASNAVQIMMKLMNKEG